MRGLVASLLRREPPSDETVRRAVRSLIDAGVSNGAHEDQLGFLRLVELFQQPIAADAQLASDLNNRFLADFPSRDPDVHWEQIRVFGSFHFAPSFTKLLAALESETNPVTRFHIGQSIAGLAGGWKGDGEMRLLNWFLSTQTGWFSEFRNKGVEFPASWQTVLTDFATHHSNALLRASSRVDFSSLLGSAFIQLLADSLDPEAALLELYRTHPEPEVRRKLLNALKRRPRPSPNLTEFLRQEELSALASAPQRSEEELHRFIISDNSRGGNASRGAAIYERLQCHTCHGGTATPKAESRIFGPDLAGVTRRLSRLELADALVYPSKQVADRYKAMEITLKDGASFIGFITEQKTDLIAFAERDQVHRFRREQVEKLAPYSTSLMPERLLSASTNQEIRDLLAYLENIGASTAKESK